MPDERSQLCARCSGFDFENLTEIYDGCFSIGEQFVVELGMVCELRLAPCPLCRLIASSSPALRDRHESESSPPLRLSKVSLRKITGSPPQGNLLRVTSSSHPWETGENIGICSIASDETGYLNVAPVSINTQPLWKRLSSPKLFDMGIARQWFEHCQQHHEIICTEAATSSIQSLWVINCGSREIVDAPPACKYVALSYVWGCAPIDADLFIERGAKLPALPKTIEDSIYVTTSLGIRYIWIDRYCIEQSHKQDRELQIQQMDLIYSAAQLTIIAAAGNDPTHGLPGINGTMRSFQAHLRLGDYLICHPIPDGKWALQNSTWASRGWTYQEGILSKRHLVFTPQQVHYECGRMHCSEVWPAQDARRPIHSKFSYLSKDLGADPLRFMACISEYYQRSLTYSGDALNAMRGFLKVFEKARHRVYHLSGVPISPPVWRPTYFSDPSSLKRSGKAVAESFIIGLFWYHIEPGERRDQFPSWSWVGWQGGKLSDRLKFELNSTYGVQILDTIVWLEDEETGDLLDFPGETEVLSFISSIDHSAAHIHIEAWTITCSIEFFKNHSVVGFYAKIPFSGTFTRFLKVHLSHSFDLHSMSTIPYMGVLVRSERLGTSELHYDTECQVLIVEDNGEHYERVGCCSISRSPRHSMLQSAARETDSDWEERDDEVPYD